MCDICFSIYGHDEDCPENFSHLTDTVCSECSRVLEKGDSIVVFQSGEVFCRDCIDEISVDELCSLCEVKDVFELIERFGISPTEKLCVE